MSPLVLVIIVGLIGLAGAFLLGRRGRWRAALLVLAAIPVAAAAAFVLLPHPGDSAPVTVPAPHAAASQWSDIVGLQPTGGMPAGDKNAESLETVTDRLARRLEREPNDGAGWLLLAQSYRYMGRAEEADKAFARARQLGVDTSGVVKGAATAAPSTAAATDAANRLRVSGERARVRRDFAAAKQDFAQLTVIAPQDADAWADLADATAAANAGSLETAAGAIERALTIDPRHKKALWLRASLELQQGKNAAAAATWQKLLGLVAPQSNDARIIEANLREARSLTAATQPAGGG